ncbi:MAG: sugar transferase [Parcubacteria group bacterium CG22_combo_CG10-13_8_21_14_all_41_9]|nr:MAG: sugar transferase [Parcubacteria group bacterium CG22_combo_CG10-13_8_21_14_all_41_9]
MTEKIRQFILFLGDVILLYLSLFLALSIRSQHIISGQIWQEHWPVFSYAFIIWIAAFYIAGSYSLANIRNNLKFFANTIRVMGINILLAIAFFYALPQARVTPKTILILTGFIFFLLLLIWRHTAHKIISKTAKRKVLIISNSNSVKELTDILDHNPQFGYQIAAILPHNATDAIGNVADYRDPEQLSKVLKKHHIDTVVLDNESKTSKNLVNNLYQHLSDRLEYISLDRFYEHITKRISLDTVDKFWFLENLGEGKKHFYDTGKRAVDILVSALFLIPSLIVIPFIGLLIAISNGFPIFFVQTRLGRNGKKFRAVKFRTMVNDAEKNGPQIAREKDKRVTKIGRILRASRLDELPQVFNILKGEMSFVGPRPERPEFVEQLEQQITFYRERLLVKPGLTGWDQISGEYHSASKEDSLKKLQYDLYYIKNRSLVLDIGIILKTIKTVLSAVGR